jgi:hypothetical protein
MGICSSKRNSSSCPALQSYNTAKTDFAQGMPKKEKGMEESKLPINYKGLWIGTVIG